jgi:hypothetical protein
MVVGKPKVRRVAGIPVDWHELTLCHYLWTIGQNVINPRIVVEIGGGYGGLANKLKLHFPSMSYVCFDLPEALTLQAFYLSELWPDARFYLFADMEEGKPYAPEQYDFTLLPGWFSKLMSAESVDLFINTRSMMEMNRETIANYFSDIQRAIKVGGAFFNVNRYRKDTVGEPICFRNYPYDDLWSVKISGPSFFQSHIHELLTIRECEPSDAVKRILLSLPSNAKLQTPSTRLSLQESIRLLPLLWMP